MRRGDYKVDWHDENMIRKIVNESYSKSEVLRKLGLTPSSNAVTFNKYIKLYKIDTSHFSQSVYRPQTRQMRTKLPIHEVLVENSDRVDRYGLKKRLVKEGILIYKCAKCGNDGTWQGEKLTLHLEHKNGINNDNRQENLEFLCPNCHSQTSTYAGRNKHVIK